jgi:hypothetical protein
MSTHLTPAELLTQGLPTRINYDGLVSRIVEANGAYVPIQPHEIAGKLPTTKQTSLTQAALQRGYRISTTTRVPGFVYAKLVSHK